MGFRLTLDEAPPGQLVPPSPGRGGLTPGKGRYRPLDADTWRVLPRRPTSLPADFPPVTGTKLDADRAGSLPDTARSYTYSQVLEEVDERAKFPVLGPTRQQTEMYLRHTPRRHNVVPVGGPEQELSVGARLLSTAEFAVFDNKEANALLLDAEAQVKSGFPTIATSSMVAKRISASVPDDMEFPPHIRFLNELVKPVQYRWKFQRERAKLMAPSKHGFHPRSQSPTFRRLLEATERLQVILEKEAADSLEKPNASEALEIERQLANEAIQSNSNYRRAKSDRSSTRSSSLHGTECTPPVKRLELHQREQPNKCEFKVTEPTIQEDESEGNDYDYDEEFETVEETAEPEPPLPPPPPARPSLRQTFKVDFKRMDSHSELHLFLPIIQDGLSRGATPDIPNAQPSHDTADLVLPTIDDTTQHKHDKKDKSKKEQKSQSEMTKKRKKKFLHRTKSGNEEKVADILNDVPTLISMENERNEPPKEDAPPRSAMLVIPKQHHSSAMCVFENCVFHSNIKSVKIRQA